MRNYYKILNVPYNADIEQVKTAYRHLAKRYHPDIAKQSTDDFIVIKEAFDVLSDYRKRQTYNKKLRLKINDKNLYRTDRINIHPIRQDVFDDLVDVFSDRFHRERKKAISIDLYLTDEEFKRGLKTEITIPIDKICSRCFGLGGTVFSSCSRCAGLGVISHDEEFEITLTPPLKTGQNHDIADGNYLLRFKLLRKN